jgi:nicotinamidase/pyrazinamidase
MNSHHRKGSASTFIEKFILGSPLMGILQLTAGDALLIVDVQNDFLPGGALAVPSGEEVIPILNRYITCFARRALPVFATRDWHPPNHCSFKSEGGIWPPHCIVESRGAAFASHLKLPDNAMIISKARSRARDAYSGFDNTNLAGKLRLRSIRRLFVGGLATETSVQNTVLDALALGFRVVLLNDAIRATGVKPDDGKLAIKEMLRQGASVIELTDIEDNLLRPIRSYDQLQRTASWH